jgi:hypothetical protein
MYLAWAEGTVWPKIHIFSTVVILFDIVPNGLTPSYTVHHTSATASHSATRT